MRTKCRIKIFSGRPDMVSLIDLLFLLFIFFLISTSLIFQPGIPVDLPRGQNTSMSAVEKIIVTIAGNGKIFINDRPVADYELQRQLQEIVENRTALIAGRWNLNHENDAIDRAPRIVIRADRKVQYEQIVEVMSLARSLGLGVYLITGHDNSFSLRLPSGGEEG